MANFFDKILDSSAQKLCVIAVPGSGKTTRVLIPKALRVLADESVDPKEVLLLTFSRLSAQDLKQKVTNSIERIPRASTVHSFGLSFLLSEDNHEIRKRVDSILLDFEKDVLLSDLKVLFPDRSRPELRSDLGKFSAGWATQPHDSVFDENDQQRAFKSAVVNWLSEHEAAMMEEIIYHAVDLAKKLPDVDFIKEPQFILVDEFQDLNHLEQEFINLLAAQSKLLIVVGDPDQSIYSFKYAFPQGITQFAQQSSVESYPCMVTGRCPKKVVAVANQLLLQANPARTDLIQTIPEAEEGEVHFVRKNTQLAEFSHVLESISKRLGSGVSAKEIIVLAPRKKLGTQFVAFANARKQHVGIPADTSFAFILKPEFTLIEQERLLLLGLYANPASLLHRRSYLGLGDDKHYGDEFEAIKKKYGGLRKAIQSARTEDFPSKKKRIRQLCERITQLNASLAKCDSEATAQNVIDSLFPENEPRLSESRELLMKLCEDGDTPKSLYSKFIDYTRTIPEKSGVVRVMTLMASKGLQAGHVYILGCNAGNIPGKNRSAHLSDYEHRQEQRRLLYVGFTRACKSLTVTWSRYLPFQQSKGHGTASVKTIKLGGKPYSVVGVSDFLQDLSGVSWEN